MDYIKTTSHAPSAVGVSPLIKDRWACPSCRAASLEEKDDRVLCRSCGAAYALDGGIPLLFTDRPHAPSAPSAFDLTLIILTLNEAHNVAKLLGDLKPVIGKLGIAAQILVLDGGSTDGTPEAARAAGAQVIVQKQRGYGRALAEGFAAAQGRVVITMDSDLSHPAKFVETLWNARDRGELVVASRYVPGAAFEAPLARKILSRILNFLFTKTLSLPVKDVSSGFRLYHREALKDVSFSGVNFEALEELLIKIQMGGWRLGEVPFHYEPRVEGRSKARLIAFGWCLLKTLFSMWRLRSSIASADYDWRAHNSRIPLQLYWQRRRHGVILKWTKEWTGAILDVGCGSSRILADLPNAVGMDVLVNKLRFMRRHCPALAGASIFDLPFADKTFEGAVCSQVIEHIPGGPKPFDELARVLKPGAHLVIGTPEYGRPWWPIIEWIYARVHPSGYADEHITHYTLKSLTETLEKAGFDVLDHDYILGAELNVLARRR